MIQLDDYIITNICALFILLCTTVSYYDLCTFILVIKQGEHVNFISIYEFVLAKPIANDITI